MKLEDKPGFVLLITSVAEIHSKKVSQHLIGIYWAALENFEFKEIKKAFAKQLINPDTGQYMPKPADIVRYLEGDYRTRALKAWNKVIVAMQSVGSYNSIVFDDFLIHAAINDMGGWVKLSRALEVDLPFRQHDFERNYMGYLIHKPDEYPNHLVGVIEQQNRLYDCEFRSLVFFGDPVLAERVYHGGQNQFELVHRSFQTTPVSKAVVKQMLEQK